MTLDDFQFRGLFHFWKNSYEITNPILFKCVIFLASSSRAKVHQLTRGGARALREERCCLSSVHLADLPRASLLLVFFYFLVPFLVSGTFNSPFERLFTFLSQYFFAIGFSYIFRFWRNIPPLLLLLVTQIHYKIPIIATLKKSNIVCDDPKRITRLSLSLTDFFQNQLFFRLLPPPQLIFLKLQRATPSQCGAVLLILIFFIFARRY